MAPFFKGKRVTAKRSGGAGGTSGRDLSKRLKTARGRTTSQQLWLQRQINDPYVARAKREGYRSRAAYKLIEIDQQHHLLKPGDRIVDLGAAPGGWSQFAAEKVGPRGKIVAIDILDMPTITGVEFAQIDFLDPSAPDVLKEMLGGQADVVLSDMAANTTGHRQTDKLRTLGLVEIAMDFAREVLSPGGKFLAKVLQGGTEGELLAQLKRDYQTVKHVKPPASRQGSSELYVLATGFRGTN
ncbi:RlmE family RNA methyltransferase [Flaviflagellibacter deserti]|jgi:23S rRNA (uridine2552-2'-O)-methyltransferase|uniref:Ribosomal RNA large subunit methyltransferase E n=1 Tax=Flaviflagellibacter deserti TaxID=2267266 RepID=A0ABV9Z2W0_9HYPH